MKTRFHTISLWVNYIPLCLRPKICLVLPLALALFPAGSYAIEPDDSLSNIVSVGNVSIEYPDSAFGKPDLKLDEAEMITPPENDAWWQRFNDPALTTLVQTAMKNNYSVKSALASIEASRQSLRQIYSGYYPSIGLSAGYNLGRQSGKQSKPYESMPTESYFSLGASMSWEIDVFGRVAAKARSGKASLNASRLEYDGVMLSLAAEVAQEYSALVMSRQQLAVAKSQLQSQQEVLDIVRARYKAGLVSKLDVAQAENMVSTTRLMIPRLEAEISLARNALMALCVIDSQQLSAIMAGSVNPVISAPELAGIPADLLRRRPDIAEAEQRIVALAANVGIAKKDYLPSLSLSASVGTYSHEFGKLFSSNSLSYSVAPQLSWTLFDGFSRSAAVAEAKAEVESETDTYYNTLRGALQEVNNAIANYNAAATELGIYQEVVATSREMVNLAIDRYKLGLTDFSDVASAQETYLDNQTSLESSRADCFNALVALYKALGGGW